MQIAICDQSRMFASIDSRFYPSDASAWRAAVSYVRRLARADGVTSHLDGWTITANRAGYSRGIFRALPVVADRSGLHLNGGRLP